MIPNRIFWVVSVPVAILLMVFFFTSWPKKIKDHWNTYQQRHEETPVPAYIARPTVMKALGSEALRSIFQRTAKNATQIGSC